MKIKRISILFFFIFIFVSMLDPSDAIFHLKKISILLFALSLLYYKIYKTKFSIYSINKELLILTLIYSLFVPIYGSFIGLINGIENYSVQIQFMISFMLFSLIILMVDDEFNFINFLIFPSMIISIIVISTLIIWETNEALYSAIYAFSMEYENMKIATRTLFNIDLQMIYYNTSALLLFTLSLFTYKLFNNYKFVTLIGFFLLVLTLILSATRANILGVLIILFLHAYFHYKKYIAIRLALILMALFFSFYLFLLFFDASEHSVMVKEQHMLSLIKSMSNIDILLGQGLGSEYYTIALDQFIFMSEIVYFEIFRIFGFIVGILVFFVLLFPFGYIYKYINKSKYIKIVGIAYVPYFISIGTNPLLFSSTGVIALWVTYGTIFNEIKKINENRKFVNEI